MGSSADLEYLQQQERLQRVRTTKQQVVDHRNVAIFGSESEKKQVSTNFKKAIDLQVHLQQTERRAANNAERQNDQHAQDFWVRIHKNSDTDNDFRKQLNREIQRENQAIADERRQREANEKFIDQCTNADHYIKYEKRNQYYF